MSVEIWKWDDCEKRLALAKSSKEETREDSGHERVAWLVMEVERWQRLYESKALELLRAQKRLEEFDEVITLALPYVECAQSDECYKPGAVASVVGKMRSVIRDVIKDMEGQK